MRKRLSLQWQLTILSALLVIAVCLTLSHFISRMALLSMNEIEDSVIAIIPNDVICEGNENNSDFYLDITEDVSGQIQNTQEAFWLESITVTLLTTLISSGLTYFIVGYALRPLQEFKEEVENIQSKNLQTSISIKNSPTEIHHLVDGFNKMLQRLNADFFAQRQFSANAAHELRTPLAIMQTELEVLEKQKSPSSKDYKETMAMIQTQTDRLSHVIDILLQMTELQSTSKENVISLSALCEEVLCDLTPLAKKTNIKLIQNKGDVKIIGNDTLIYRAMFNLIENGIKYNHESGSVTVDIKQEAEFVKIYITNTGPGIETKDCEKIFEPFFRVDKSRSRSMGGAGLGLALVKEIAIQHGGNVKVIQSTPENTIIE